MAFAIALLVGLVVILKLTALDSIFLKPQIKLIHRIETNQSVCYVMFSSDGSLLLSAGQNSKPRSNGNDKVELVMLSPVYSICLWNSMSSELINHFTLDERLLAAAFSADDSRIITVAGGQAEVSVWNVQTGRKERSFYTIENTQEAGIAEKAAISGNGRYVAISLSWPGGVRVMNVADGSLARSISWKKKGKGSLKNGGTGPLKEIQGLALSQDGGRMLASTGYDWSRSGT